MKMHKFSLLAALAVGALIALAPTLRAEHTNSVASKGPRVGQRGEMVKERLEKLATELNLTADQKTKIAAALKEQAETLRGLKDASKEERREQMKTARTALAAQMKTVLTAEQFAKWEKIRETRGSRQGGEKPEKS